MLGGISGTHELGNSHTRELTHSGELTRSGTHTLGNSQARELTHCAKLYIFKDFAPLGLKIFLGRALRATGAITLGITHLAESSLVSRVVGL